MPGISPADVRWAQGDPAVWGGLTLGVALDRPLWHPGLPQAHFLRGSGRKVGPLTGRYCPHLLTGPLQPLWEALEARSRGRWNRGPSPPAFCTEGLSRWVGRSAAWTGLAGTPSSALAPSCGCPAALLLHGNPVLEGMPGLAVGNPTCSRGPFPNWLLRP